MKSTRNIVVIGSPSYGYLAQAVAKRGKWPLIKVQWGSYPGGSHFHRVDRHDVAGKRVVIVGGTVTTAERDSVLNAASTLMRLKAESVVIANACMGTQRDEKWTHEAQHPAAKLELRQFSSLPKASSIDLLLFDLHNEAVSLYGEGDLFVAPCRYNSATMLAVRKLKADRIGSTDIGGRGRVRRLAEQTGLLPVFCDKERFSTTEVDIRVASSRKMIEGKRIVLLDDILETGTTADAAAKAYRDFGAKDVSGIFSHALTTEASIKRLRSRGNITKIIFTNSHPRALEIAAKFRGFVDLIDVSAPIRDAILDPWNWLP